MTKYRLEMTEEQARMMIAALDFWMRMRMGQFGELIDLVMPVSPDGNVDDYLQKKECAEQVLLCVRNLLMPDLRGMNSLFGSYSVYKLPETERAFDLLKSIRSCIAWHNNPDGGYEVIYDRPHGEAPKCEAVEDEKGHPTSDTSAD